jgi:fructooligosaccharide transport system substrate-binding protein
MQTRIRILAIIAIVMMGLTACKPKAPPTASLQPEEPMPLAVSMPPLSTAIEPCPTLESTADSGKERIVWMVPDSFQNLEAVVKAFESKYPQIIVDLSVVNVADYFTASQKLFAAGCAAPDVFNVQVELSPYYAAYGWLTSLWNEYTFDEKEDWIQALRKSGRYAQELYSAPFSTTTGLLFYNADLFTIAGVEPPAENTNWTWEKVAATARELTRDANTDGTPETWGFAWADDSVHTLLPLAQSLGGQPLGNDGVTVAGVIDSKPWVEAMTYYSNVFNTWGTAPVDPSFNATAAFLSGQLAMVVGDAALIDTFSTASFSWGVSGYPYFKKGLLILPTGDWQLGLNPNSAHHDAAVTLLKWLTTQAGGSIVWENNVVALPAQKTVLATFNASPRYSGAPNSFWKIAAKEALVFTLPGAITPFYSVYDDKLQDAFLQIRQGADPQTVLSQTAANLQDAMK